MLSNRLTYTLFGALSFYFFYASSKFEWTRNLNNITPPFIQVIIVITWIALMLSIMASLNMQLKGQHDPKNRKHALFARTIYFLLTKEARIIAHQIYGDKLNKGK